MIANKTHQELLSCLNDIIKIKDLNNKNTKEVNKYIEETLCLAEDPIVLTIDEFYQIPIEMIQYFDNEAKELFLIAKGDGEVLDLLKDKFNATFEAVDYIRIYIVVQE